MILALFRLILDFLSGGDPTWNPHYPALLGLSQFLTTLRDLILTALGV